MKSLHSGGRLSLPLPPFSFTPIERLTDGFCSRWRKNISGDGEKIGSSRKGGEQTRAQAKRQKATRGRSMKARPTQSRKGVKGGLRPFSSAPCRVKGQRPLWGLVQRPNWSSPDQSQGSRQQRRRQRSVPTSNFALPQERPQAALSTTCTLSRQMGATDQHREKSFLGAGLFCCREISPLRRRPEGFAVALWTPSAVASHVA